MNFKKLALLICPLLLIGEANAQKKAPRPKKKTQSERKGALSPEEQLKQFRLPEGFIIELVASEENGLINPIDLAFDSSGKLWTGTARMYPLDPVGSVGRKMLEALDRGEFDNNPQFQKMRDLYQRKTKGSDQILVIEDPTKKTEGQIPVYAEGMTIPQSFMPYKDGVFVAHGSEMLFLSDKDRDGKAETQETVLTGFGFTDTHTMAHTFVRGPGGWIHFSHGALNKGLVTAVKSGKKEKINYSKIARFSLDGNNLEVINNGWNNIWGFSLKANGQWYGSEANDLGFSLAPLHPYMGYKGIGNERLRPYQPFGGEFHKFKVEGTGISGLAYDENGNRGFPKEYKKAGFLANPITSKINLVIADRKPDGSIISKHLPDFLTCKDDWFRPVNIEFGPDGCLYIVDWYNKIVSHNEVDRNHPDRDKKHGRIWRVRHKSQATGDIPNIAKASNQDLLKHLKAEILWQKRSAWTEIVDRNAKELAPELIKIASNNQENHITRIHALWALEGLNHYDLDLLTTLTSESDPDIKREALRSLETFKPNIEDIVTLTKPLINDPHYMVKEQLLRTLKNIGKANSATIEMLITYANPQEKKGAENIHPFGDSYEQNFQSFLAFMALEQYPNELAAFLESPAVSNISIAQKNEATKCLPEGIRTNAIVSSILNGAATLDVSTLIALSPGLKNPEVLRSLKSYIVTKEFIQLALEAQSGLKASDLHLALEPAIKKLLNSSDSDDQQLAQKAIIHFHQPGFEKEITALLSKIAPQDIIPQNLELLAINPKKYSALLKGFVKNAQTSEDVKAQAAILLALADKKSGYLTLDQLITAKENTTVINTLKSNSHGMLYLLDAINKKKLPVDKLTPNDKATILTTHPKPAKLFRKKVNSVNAKENKEAALKINKVAEAYKKRGGNLTSGEAIFNSCLVCHQSGNKGVNLAPALGGYKDRDPKHLLTAIIQPNAAIEKGYEIYRVTKKNGEQVQGFMFNKSSYGTTIASAGGATTFIAKERILSEGFLSKKSNMPSFATLPEQTLIDLVAYLKSL